jgi:riboflavin kinase / FMN adenylyltransferase
MAGRLDEARTMLGRPYRIRGVVVRGAGRGAQLGYPTANVGRIDTLLPGEGIYAARAQVQDRWHPAAVSLGPSPTFGVSAINVEAHLIGFHGVVNDLPIEIDFHARLRDIERFASVDSLLEQIAKDVAQTIKIVGEGFGH